ncbi:MAG: NAD(P)/FAD-dependent oxidoreductase [Candidatus Omnitrophica bacterium]|nr:NAD(P)/FAD-dependent oxidoreductase [Candidatus Omnitrophota bacterium]
MDKNKQIIVIGAGPSGMMAAIAASSRGCGVTLTEKKETPGRKLLLTGGGRCNLTNTAGLDVFLAKYGKNGQFLRDAFKAFFSTDLVNFLGSRGLKCYEENNENTPHRKIFPEGDKAKSVLQILENELRKNHVSLLSSSPVADVVSSGGHVSGIKFANEKFLACSAVILATGGVSYPGTGSTGDGYMMAEKLGHKIITPKAALASLVTKEAYPSMLTGLTLLNVALTIISGKRHFSTEKGNVLFTSNGLTGPLALSVSGMISDLIFDKKTVEVSIDLLPDTAGNDLDKELNDLFLEHSSKTAKNNLKELIPERLAEIIIERAGIDLEKRSNQLSSREKILLSEMIKDFRLTITRTAHIKEGMVTRGGVSLKEIDPRTMASRLVKGLYFAGEVIDIDGETGGFNLQAAFSTGYLAGLSAAALNF